MKVRLKYIAGIVSIVLGATVVILSCATEGTVDPKYKDHFVKYYGGDGNQVARDFVVNSDGSIVMVGTSIEANGDTTRIYLVKADSEGNVIWSKKLGTGRESARDIDVFASGSTFENHYMILSNCKRFESDSTDVKVLVVNPSGEAVDSTIFSLEAPANYGYFMSAYGYSLTALSDGGYLIAGNIDSAALPLDGKDPSYEDVKDRLSVRYDGNLNLINPEWKTSFGGEPYAMAVKIFESGSQLFYVGYSDEMPPGGDAIPDRNMVFVKLSTTGDAQGTALYSKDGRGVSEIMSGITTSFNGFYIAIGTQIDVNDHKVYACIVDGTFSNIIIDGTVEGAPGQADGVAIAESQQNPGTFWALANESRTGGRDIWVGRVNSGLDTEIQFTFGGSNNDDTGSAIKELDNGDLLILGTMELVNQTKMALIKVRPNGSFN
jgi:hypothetical protein